MAEAIIQRSCAKIRSAIGDDNIRRLNFTGDLQEMLDALDIVKPLLEKSAGSLRIRRAAYRICDIVDELQGTRTLAAGKVRSTLPCLGAVRRNKTLAKDMQTITNELRTIHQEFCEVDSASLEQDTDVSETTPEVEEQTIIGRAEDKQRVMDALFGSELKDGPIILPIFGLEGTGKTALAQIVLKDAKFREYNFRAWFHVSQKLDLLKIGKSMLFLASGEDCPDSNAMDYIMKRLREIYTGTKVIVVFDGLGESADPILLQSLKSFLISVGDKGSKVIITTRKKSTARKLSTVEPLEISRLSDGMCWEIIKKASHSGGEQVNQELEKIGRQIAKKCMGQPSAAVVLGAMLDGEDIEEWASVMKIDMGNDMKSMNTALKKKRLEYYETSCDVSQQVPQITLEEELVKVRDGDLLRIMDLLSKSNVPTILPIFGFRGIGKTTMAQCIFREVQFREYDFRAWVPVSGKFNLLHTTKMLLFLASGEDSGHNIRYIKERLSGLYNGMKVLIVLDGLDQELDSTRFESFKRFLLSIEDGSKVIVIITTSSEGLARNICTHEPYKLNPLTDDMCWTIIKKRSLFEDTDDKDKFEQIGKQIALKCLGLPLLAQEIGEILCYEDLVEWERVLDHDTVSRSRATRSLKESFDLSYRSLPPDLRICFAYCAIFPKGRNIVKVDLIHQWTVLDLIHPSGTQSVEELAEHYICLLSKVSFLQTVTLSLTSRKDGKDAILFAMHDLVHDYAVTVSEELIAFSQMEEETQSVFGHEQESLCPKKYRSYARIMCTDLSTLKKSSKLPDQPMALCCSNVVIDSKFSYPRSLRVLLVADSRIQKLPDSCVRELMHLGYLNLSGCSGLESLPQSFGDLVKLVHINLSGCSGLLHLPLSFGDLESLSHINLSGCTGLRDLPESFGDLINLKHMDLSRCHGLLDLRVSLRKLQKLAYLDLSFSVCCKWIPVICDLTNLQHLNLSHSCYYTSEKDLDLKDALGKLTSVRYLNLSMCLNHILYYLSEQESLKYIESCIGTLANLEHLDLSHNTFLFDLPECQSNLSKLHTLDLSGCIRLKRVQKWMSELGSLSIKNCTGLESCEFSVHDHGSSSSLVNLENINCKQLDIFCLESLNIEEVQRTRLADKQELQILKLHWTVDSQRSVDDSDLLGHLAPPNSLEQLELHGYSGATCLPAWFTDEIISYGGLPNLVVVTLEGFPKCTVLPPIGLLSNLKQLVLRRMANLKRIDAGELSGGNPTSFSQLSKFIIEDMKSLEEFNTTYVIFNEELNFCTLGELEIVDCPNMCFVPLPPIAPRVVITGCENLMTASCSKKCVERPCTSAPVTTTELVVQRCNVPVGDWRLLHHLPGLQSLTIKNCENLISEENNRDNLTTISPEIIQVLSSLRSLCFSDCNITEIPLRYLGDYISLNELAIDGCGKIKHLPESIYQLENLEVLYIWESPSLMTWCDSMENKKKLARFGPKYEKFASTKTGGKALQRQTTMSVHLDEQRR